jgi:hypothetical protein
MIIQIDVRGFTEPAVPSKYQPPLPVHAGGMKAIERALQLLEMVARRNPQIPVRGCIVEHRQPSEQTMIDIGRNPLRSDIIDEEIAEPRIAEADDYSLSLFEAMYHSLVLSTIAAGSL